MADKEKQVRQREAFIVGDFAPESLSLELRCKSCGAVNRYEVNSVIAAQTQDKAGAHLIRDEFPCVSCDQFADFELTSNAVMALSAEMLRQVAAKDDEQQKHSLITFMDCQLNGQTMPVATALKQLKERTGIAPDDALTWFQQGKLLAHVNRPRAASPSLSQAARLAPKAVDVTLALAKALTAKYENAAAFALLADALKRLSEWQFLSPQSNFWQEFSKNVQSLAKRLNRNDLPMLHPSALIVSRKTGRNDPCSCGSGKKFKKCCGN